MIPTNSSPDFISPFQQTHSAALRVWHWLTFLFILGSVTTVLFNSTLYDPRDNVKLVQDQLKEKGIVVNEEQAFAVSHEYEDKMWDVHKWIGYGLSFLFLARVMIEFTQPEEEKLRNKFKKIKELQAKNDMNKAEYTHFLRVKMSYSVFFLILFCMVLTGLGMAFGRNLGFGRDLHHNLKEIHAFMQYLMYAFILLHLGGVIFAENGRIRGIVSGMIHGNK